MGATSCGAGYFYYPQDYFEKICQKNEDSKVCSYGGGFWGMFCIRHSPKTILTYK